MKVRTIRPHQNDFAPAFIKNKGRVYEPDDRTAAKLIAMGMVEKYTKPKEKSGEG